MELLPWGHLCLSDNRTEEKKKIFPYMQSCAGAALLCAAPSHWTVLISSDRAPLS